VRASGRDPLRTAIFVGITIGADKFVAVAACATGLLASLAPGAGVTSRC
jgi:hypothetical protein